MPKYTKATERAKAKKLAKTCIENNFNQSAIARKEGISHQAVNQRVNRQPVQDCLAEFLESKELKKKLIDIGLEGLEAKKPIGATILMDDDGKTVKAPDEGAIAVKDFAVRHKYWHDLMIASGGIKLDKSQQGITIVTVVYGHRSKSLDSALRHKEERRT